MDEGGDSRLLKGASTDDPMGGDGDKGQIKNSEIQYLFSHERDQFPNKAYHEDGNPEMYSKENIERRRALMHNDVVVDAINDFMKEFKMNSQGQVSRDEYFRVFINVGSLLRPGIDADDLQKIIKEEFEADTQDNKQLFVTEDEQKEAADREAKAIAEGNPPPVSIPKTYDFIDQKKLFNALFELADVWCPNIDEYEYKAFFETLRFKFRYPGQ
jgi:hypothetical protein